jgi:hypothetical protein
MTLEEAQAVAQEQANEFGLPMLVVRDDLSEDPGGFSACAEMYLSTLYSVDHRQFWEVVSRVVPG